MIIKKSCKTIHPGLHVVLEIFRKILIDEGMVDADDESQCFHFLGQWRCVRQGQCFLAGLDKKGKKRFLDFFQCVENDGIKGIASVDMTKGHKNSVGSLQDTIDDGSVAGSQFCYQARQEALPLFRVIRFCDEKNGFRNLCLNVRRNRAHELYQVLFDSVAVRIRNDNALALFFVLVRVPSGLDAVFEINGGRLSCGHGGVPVVDELQQLDHKSWLLGSSRQLRFR